jgi:acetoacetyl-CoA synthetase
MSPIWTPSRERTEATNMHAFMRRAQSLDPTVVDYESLHAFSVVQPQAFWPLLWEYLEIVGERGDTLVDDIHKMPGAAWFPGARLNFAENLLRRRDDALAIIHRTEDGKRRTLSWAQLYVEVGRCMAGLRRAGVQPGDRVAGYLPNEPEAVIAMLATTGLGAIWAACSPEYGVASCLERLKLIEPKVLFAGEGYHYGGKWHDLAAKAAEIAAQLPSLVKTVNVPACPEIGAERSPDGIDFPQFPFAHPAFILFSSGTTGTPKCVTHCAGGTLLQLLKDMALHCDIRRDERVLYVTTTGWMVWNVMTASLGLGAPIVLYDGSPLAPSPARMFDLVDEEDVAILRIVPKLIDEYARAGLHPARSHRLAKLKCIKAGSEPLLPHHCEYVYQRIKADVHLMSPAGGTDVMGTLATGNPMGPVIPGEIQARALGMKVEVFDEHARPVIGRAGELVVTQSFPSIPVGFWGDESGERLRAAFFGTYPGAWRHGDWAEITGRGGVAIRGRSDATLNVNGVRIGTSEIYRALRDVKGLRESAAVERRSTRGSEVVLFVLLEEGVALDPALAATIRDAIRRHATPRHVPGQVHAVPDLPRSSNGKVSEAAIRDTINGTRPVSVQGLLNPGALAHFRAYAVAEVAPVGR